jgi:hypothetical protein
LDKPKRVVSILAAGIVKGDVLLTFKSEDGSALQIAIHPGIAAPLVVSLMGLGSQLATAGQNSLLGQRTTLTASIPAVGPNGEPVLDLVLEGGMQFPVTFPKSAITLIQKALTILQRKSTGRNPTKESKN